MAARIFLGLSALVWLPYGLLCLLGAALDGALSSYTGMALGLELGTVAVTALLLRRAPALAA